MWKYYVYELIDPRDGQPFYVGKGCGNRISAHERMVSRGKDICSEKALRIKDIWADDLQVEQRFVAFFKREQPAYDFEADRIASYGLDALTNLAPGGGTPRGQRAYIEKPAAPWGPVELAEFFVKHDHMAYCFATWLKARVLKCNIELQAYSFVMPAIKWIYKEQFPKFWEMLKSSREAIEVIRPSMSRHGVGITYGSA